MLYQNEDSYFVERIPSSNLWKDGVVVVNNVLRTEEMGWFI